MNLRTILHHLFIVWRRRTRRRKHTDILYWS